MRCTFALVAPLVLASDVLAASETALPPPPVAEQSEAPRAQSPDVDDPLQEFRDRDERNVADRAFPVLSAKLPFKTVSVCWENPTENDVNERRWVRQAVENSWQKHSALEFTYWAQCTEAHKGVRILIEDSGPLVKYMGKYLLGIKSGMVLNFTFNSWGQSCKSDEAGRRKCIESIGVHEFGHAIGFAHEQNRPDTPGDCTKEPQGADGDVLLTPWDPKSVMNYCNSTYNNDGKLSDFDIFAVQVIYGKKE